MRISIVEDLKAASADLGLIGMEHTEYLRDVLTTLKELTLFCYIIFLTLGEWFTIFRWCELS